MLTLADTVEVETFLHQSFYLLSVKQQLENITRGVKGEVATIKNVPCKIFSQIYKNTGGLILEIKTSCI